MRHHLGAGGGRYRPEREGKHKPRAGRGRQRYHPLSGPQTAQSEVHAPSSEVSADHGCGSLKQRKVRSMLPVVRYPPIMAAVASLAVFGLLFLGVLLWVSQGVPILKESADQLVWRRRLARGRARAEAGEVLGDGGSVGALSSRSANPVSDKSKPPSFNSPSSSRSSSGSHDCRRARRRAFAPRSIPRRPSPGS
jgi:hypothetical protein